MPLGKEVDLGPCHIVLDGDPVGTHSTAAPPHFSAHVYCGQTVAHLTNCWAFVAHLSAESLYTLQWAISSPSKLPHCMGNLDGSLGSSEPTLQMASRLQLFL